MTPPAPPSSPDAAAVEAVEKIHAEGWLKEEWPKSVVGQRCFPRDKAARIITDAYKPRLTAEREVREKLVAALDECYVWLSRESEDRNKPETWSTVISNVHVALAAAEKLEKQDA